MFSCSFNLCCYSPPPADSLYADPNTIEHEAAPGTEDQYAMVDRKVKKNTKPKPTPPEALYQVLHCAVWNN